LATVLFGWELGGGHGHVQNLLRVARELAGLGHSPVFAIRNLNSTASVFRNDPFPVLQAPFWHPIPQRGEKPFVASTFADILAIRGFDDVNGLSAVVGAWQSLLDLLHPELIVCEFSPTLCLTAYGSLPIVMIGSGFSLPPIEQSVFPTLLPQAKPVTAQAVLFDVVRAVQVRRRRAIPPALTSVFGGDRFVIVLPEIDPYRSVRRETCCGPIQPLPKNSHVPADAGIFAYLSDDRPAIQHVLITLSKAGLKTSAYLREVSCAVVQRLREAGVSIYDHPPPLTEVLPACRAILHHGGASTSQLALAAGRSQVIWPQHLEQSLTAKAVSSLGVGACLPVDAAAETVAKAVVRVSTGQEFARQAAQLAEMLHRRGLTSPLPVIVDRCASLLR
jgi:hypothetical protein